MISERTNNKIILYYVMYNFIPTNSTSILKLEDLCDICHIVQEEFGHELKLEFQITKTGLVCLNMEEKISQNNDYFAINLKTNEIELEQIDHQAVDYSDYRNIILDVSNLLYELSTLQNIKLYIFTNILRKDFPKILNCFEILSKISNDKLKREPNKC